VTVRPRIARAVLLAKGIEVHVSVDEPSTVAVVLDSQALQLRKVKGDPTPRPKTTLLARVRKTHKGDGTQLKVRLKLGKTPRAVLRRKRRSVQARLMVTARDSAGNERTVVKKVMIGPVL